MNMEEPSPGDRDGHGPLEHLTVLDFTRVLAGPFATMMLADLGAEAFKVEPLDSGDEARGFGPFRGGSSGYFAGVNRGKKSIALDLKTDRGVEIALEMAEGADILVENFRPRVMERLGLGWDQVHALNPALIYASCSGFGQTGPYAERPAYDVIVQAMSGLMSITGPENTLEPVRAGASLADLSAATFTVIGVLAALQERERTGMGRRVDVGMLDSMVALLENAITRYDVTGETPSPLGTRHPSIAPFQVFATQDGHVAVRAANQRIWERLCHALNAEELLADPSYQNNKTRTDNHGRLNTALEPIFSQRTTAEWLEELDKASVPAGPVNKVSDIVADRHIRTRGMIHEVRAPGNVSFQTAGQPIHMDPALDRPSDYAPALGEHTREVLGNRLGMSARELQNLAGAHVTGGPAPEPEADSDS